MKSYQLLLVILFAVTIKQTCSFRWFWNWDCKDRNTCNQVDVKILEEKEEQFNPIYLIGNLHYYKLAEPLVIAEKPDQLKILYGSLAKLIYACPKNFKNGQSRNIVPMLQRSGTIKPPREGEYSDVCCPTKVKSTIRNMGQTCHQTNHQTGQQTETKTYTLYEIGFEVYMESWIPGTFKKFKQHWENTWHPLYTVCHHNKSRTTLYSRHKLLDVALDSKLKRSATNFQDYDEDTNKAENELLKKAFSKEEINKLFSRLPDKEFLAKGHLTPDADMVFPPWKRATFLYVNVVPMWQSVNNEHWKALENTIRKVSKKLQTPLTVYTGTYGTLTYTDGTELFLSSINGNDVMPVPAYLWKAIYNENTNEAIVFITANGDFNSNVDAPCSTSTENICENNGWSIDGIYCCEVQTFRKEITYAPYFAGTIMKNPCPDKKCL